MNLPLINNDNVGNSYYGWTTNNLDWAPESLGFTPIQCANWINGFFGQTCALANATTGFHLILPVSFESLSLPVTASKFRFNNLGISRTTGNPSTTTMDAQYCAINCLNLLTVIFNRPSSYYWAVLNSHSLSIFNDNYLENNSQRHTFFSCGWLRNPLFPQSDFVQNAYFLWTVRPDSNSRAAGRPSLGGSARQNFVLPTATTPDPIANYLVSCQTATPGANATEFYLRDNVAPNKAVGYVPNLLKCSLDIPVGGIYSNKGIDPDGSNIDTWKCVAKIGNESLLMRVWATGLV
jgi:hypothetical protein